MSLSRASADTPSEFAFDLSVVGLGYVGLPLAATAAASGLNVLGVDCKREALETIRDHNNRIVEESLRGIVQQALAAGRLTLALEPVPTKAFLIAVQTPITTDKCADLTYVVAAARSIVPHLRKGCSVILESTVPVGTTEDVLCPILGDAGLSIGTDVFVAFCPERVLPGNIVYELLHTPRLIGGINEVSARRIAELYSTFVESEVTLTHARVAEMAKLVENTFRDANIALANELATIAAEVGVDVWEVIDLANRHPRVNILKPGPGVGGHCVPVDPYFLIEAAADKAPLLRTARQVNDGTPARVAEMAICLADSPNPQVAVLGVTYKANVDDTRLSPALKIIDTLQRQGVRVRATDPYATDPSLGLYELTEALRGAELLILATDHDQYRDLDAARVGELMAGRKVLDTRNCLDRAKWQTAGFEVYRVGSPVR
jgi:UDP-N-acetyl-D-mannosaminuronic acid dehydrogenase